LENLKAVVHSEDPSVDGKMMVEGVFSEVGWEVVDWFHLAQDRVQSRLLWIR